MIIVVGNKGSWEGVSILLESTQNRVCGSGSREDTSAIAKVNVYKYKVSASRVRVNQFKIFLVETNIFHSWISKQWCIPMPGVNDVFFSATLLVWCSCSAISPSATLLFFYLPSLLYRKLPFTSLPTYTPPPNPLSGPSTCKQNIHPILSPLGLELI